MSDISRSQGKQLYELPDELLCQIFEYLPKDALYALNLSSRWGANFATPILWRTVELLDCEKTHMVEDHSGDLEPQDCLDAHDDTPIIRKLFILASNPQIACHVSELSHRCHLNPPAIFTELPAISFKSRTLSAHPGTLRLLQLAIANMTNVQTLRIIYGHWYITTGLLQGFICTDKPSNLRRLWLENCALEGVDLMKFQEGALISSLESVRIRRMYITDSEPTYTPLFALARGGEKRYLQNGRGSGQLTTVILSEDRLSSSIPDQETELLGPGTLTQSFDELIWDNAKEVATFLETEGFHYKPAQWQDCLQSEILPSQTVSVSRFFAKSLAASASSLTSLNLDWILWPSFYLDNDRSAMAVFQSLADLRFPNLRAFQLRNSVVQHSLLPDEIFLLDESVGTCNFVGFMEYHAPKLRCLGWPMDRFFSARYPKSPEVAQRAINTILQLGSGLTDLRIDSDYSSKGETLTDACEFFSSTEMMIRRRKFIQHFVAYMRSVRQLKLEGGIPRDEKREAIRALGNCPLQKLVMIGVSCPFGNSWGRDGERLQEIDKGQQQMTGILEEESDEQIWHSMTTDPTTVYRPPRFEPTYGWSPGPPMTHIIASHFAGTITELKFCGYNGSTILGQPTPITTPMLSPLRYFHNLHELVLSMWLLTFWEGDYCDESIVDFWIDQRSPSSTALAMVNPSTDPNSWSNRLQTVYAPAALANQVAKQIGPFLSPRAKARPGGVRVRASFCMGTTSGDIFDLDVKVGEGDVVKNYRGPREEAEPGRRKEKLESRRWF